MPTISILLGLPIPFANIGSLVPALLPLRTSTIGPRSKDLSTANVATALALNAAQVWEYFTTYSSQTNSLPSQAMVELKALLDDATYKHKNALSYRGSEDSMEYRQACALYKVFLSEATKLGKRLWTTFDTKGMMFGILVVLSSLLLDISLLFPNLKNRSRRIYLLRVPGFLFMEFFVATILMVFQCVMLTFSNSYINSEQNIIMFSLSILCVILAVHRGLLRFAETRLRLCKIIPNRKREDAYLARNDIYNVCWMLLLIPCCSRLGEIFVAGHGMDPSIPKYSVHDPFYFILSLAALSFLRIRGSAQDTKLTGMLQVRDVCDLSSLIALGLSWLEKRSIDTARNGYVMCRISIALSLVSLFTVFLRSMAISQKYPSCLATIITYLTLLMAVTGPSSGPSAILFLTQLWSLSRITKINGPGKVGFEASASESVVTLLSK